jgi:hypothetical protein
MNNFWLEVLNYFFFVFHTVLIVFNVFGWIFVKTRKLHLFVLLITLFSWFVLGIWYGFGYCFLTDWHYEVLRKLGETQMPQSYIAFLIQKLTGWLPEAQLVNISTVVITMLALIASVWVNFFRKKNL